MFDFIRIQFTFGKLTADEVLAFAPKFITEEEAQRIIEGGVN